MAMIDTMVVRDGKWVSESATKPVPGEPCVDISDAYGVYFYQMGAIPEAPGERVAIFDRDKSGAKEAEFDNICKQRNLPPFFGQGNRQ